MKDVYVVGMGTTQYGKSDYCAKDLAIKSVSQALNSCGVDKEQVDELYLGNFISGIIDGQETLGSHVTDGVGLTGIPAMKVEGACASSGIAFKQACRAISTGIADIVIAVGTESMTKAPTSKFTRALGSAADQNTDGTAGLTFPGFYGLWLDRYMNEFNIKRKYIASVPVKNRKNGVKNPRARFRSEITTKEVINSRSIANPLNLYDCCAAADGSTAVILASSEISHSITNNPIKVLGVGHATGISASHRYNNLLTLDATVDAAKEAYKQAKVGPNDIDVVELHDCFSAAEIGDSEDLGFFKKGEGAIAAVKGKTAIDGEIPINPSGGLLSKGHPVGATGLGQIYEICKQLKNDHENQVNNAEVGLAHNLGGSGAVSTVTILGNNI